MTGGIDELIVFLMREFHWQYEYARDLVGKLPVEKLNALIKETQYQKAMDEYRQDTRAAMIVACLASSKTHPKTVKSIIGDPPKREGETRRLKTAAEREGIILPKES